mmetsp:Transcript_32731/g.52693  ORF Transcript_32731/g.52693 Transcript_32731/m.52693 type:complete len:361 (+) Transcript_32731:1041-2123(+)
MIQFLRLVGRQGQEFTIVGFQLCDTHLFLIKCVLLFYYQALHFFQVLLHLLLLLLQLLGFHVCGCHHRFQRLGFSHLFLQMFYLTSRLFRFVLRLIRLDAECSIVGFQCPDGHLFLSKYLSQFLIRALHLLQVLLHLCLLLFQLLVLDVYGFHNRFQRPRTYQPAQTPSVVVRVGFLHRLILLRPQIRVLGFQQAHFARQLLLPQLQSCNISLVLLLTCSEECDQLVIFLRDGKPMRSKPRYRLQKALQPQSQVLMLLVSKLFALVPALLLFRQFYNRLCLHLNCARLHLNCIKQILGALYITLSVGLHSDLLLETIHAVEGAMLGDCLCREGLGLLVAILLSTFLRLCLCRGPALVVLA